MRSVITTNVCTFFRELKRVLAPGGRVIVTEHLRDLANIAAYSIGAWHFHQRARVARHLPCRGFSSCTRVAQQPHDHHLRPRTR